MRLRTFTLLMAAFLLLAGHAGAAPASAPVKSVPPAKPTLLRDDPLLQEKVTLEATDRPLGDVLKDVSLTLKMDLTASSQIADQRVTLRLTDQPVYLLMNRLPQLLSHAPGKPRGYYWERLDRPAKGRPAFNLWRDLRSVQDEEYEWDYPRREVARMLRDMRDLCWMTPKERRNYHGDYPYVPLPDTIKEQPFGQNEMALAKALKPLTDEQLDALMDGKKIALDSRLFTAEIAAAKQTQRDEMKHRQEIAKLTNNPDPYPNGIPEPPDIVPTISVKAEDDDGRVMSHAFLHGIYLDGIEGVAPELDPYDTFQNPDPNRVARSMFAPHLAKALSPVVDLTPLLQDKSVTPEQRGSVGFTLQALAKAAHMTLYQEAFLKPSANTGFRSSGITTLKAPLSDLILEICEEWNYQALKVGDDYYFWSRTWALDRAADIPKRLISKWQERYRKQGMVSLDDHIEIASAITWPQTFTLSQVLPEGCPRDFHSYTMLRLLGLLSPAEREAASSGVGIALAGLSPEAQQTLADGFRRDLAKVPGNQLEQAVLRLESPPPGMREGMVGANVQAGGQTIFGAILEASTPPAAPLHP